MIKVLKKISHKSLIMKKVFIVFISILILTGCDSDEMDTIPPVISVPPIAIDHIDTFIPFGADLTPTQKNPAIEYFTDQANVSVRSVSEGVVVDIRGNPNIDDYEIWVRPSDLSKWLIIYDHILNIEVSIGDQIAINQTIGTVGVNNRTELQINDNQNLAYCPLQFGTDSFTQQHLNFSENWCLEETVIP